MSIKETLLHTVQRFPRLHLIVAGVIGLLVVAIFAFTDSSNQQDRTQLNVTPPISATATSSITAEAETSDTKSTTQAPHFSFDNGSVEQASTNNIVTTTTIADSDIDTPAEPSSPPSTASQSDANAAAQPQNAQPAQQSPEWITITIKKGDNLYSLFDRAGLPAAAVAEFLQSTPKAKSLNALYPGETLHFLIKKQRLEALKHHAKYKDTVLFERQSDGSFDPRVTSQPLRPFPQYIHGSIESSLFLSAKKAGLSERLTMKLAQIFGWDIDFAMDIRERDQFKVIYEDLYRDGEKVREGNILAATFVNNGKTYTAIRFTKSNGETEYFSPDGKSMRKAFLRTPVDFARISSHFNLRRKHPILHTIRAHKGTDYAARPGTPIKASGAGKVRFIGTKGGYGRTVILQHGRDYKTLYAHMQKFARGLRVGHKVKQGQVIGYVGSSGLASGPHLHYEFHYKNKVKNPLTVSLPNAQPINKKDRPAFLKVASEMHRKMQTYSSTASLQAEKPAIE